MKGPFLTAKAAAKYLSYKTDSFRRLAREYQLPRYGPKRNRYSQADLDLFMEDKNHFKTGQAENRRHQYQMVTV
jgi:hypothetical protein